MGLRIGKVAVVDGGGMGWWDIDWKGGGEEIGEGRGMYMKQCMRWT